MDSTLQDLADAMKYAFDNMDPSATVESLTSLCATSNTTSIKCELFRFNRAMILEASNTLLYTVVETDQFKALLRRYLPDHFTLLPFEYDYKVDGKDADIVRDDILVYARFSLPTHYHNSEPCWERATDCVPCPACGGRMEPGEYAGLGCSRACAYRR